MIDGFEAHRDEDYRKSVLYSAIAMESYAARVVDEAYQKVVGESQNHAFRVIEEAGPGFDPVFQYLRNGRNFSRFLHELPLYLWKRSLRLEDKKLYEDALKLYRTRNSVAHQGFVAITREDIHELSPSASLECQHVARRVLNWLGDPEHYPEWGTLVPMEGLAAKYDAIAHARGDAGA